jgi:hypothetical protein
MTDQCQHDIHDAIRGSGFTRAQIDLLRSRHGVAVSSYPQPPIGHSRPFAAADIFRLAVFQRLSALGLPWDVIISVDALTPFRKLDANGLPAEFFSGEARGGPAQALIAWLPSGSTDLDQFDADITTMDNAGRALRHHGAGLSVVLNLTSLAAEVRHRLSEI